jgi:hypothetical protein
MPSSRMEHGRWRILHLEPNQLAASGSIRTSENKASIVVKGYA